MLKLSLCVHQAARCDCCKVQGNLTESVMWRAEMKHFCDQECLLKFYCQQNEPIMVTQKGPENSSLGTNRVYVCLCVCVFYSEVLYSYKLPFLSTCWSTETAF